MYTDTNRENLTLALVDMMNGAVARAGLYSCSTLSGVILRVFPLCTRKKQCYQNYYIHDDLYSLKIEWRIVSNLVREVENIV